MTLRSTIMFLALCFFTLSLFGQRRKVNVPNLKGTTQIDYYVTVKLVDKEPQFKPTYLFASKLDPKQKKWNLDTTKINIDNYFLTNKSIDHVSYSLGDCACDLFGDTTGNGVAFIHLKQGVTFVTVSKLIETLNISFDSLTKEEIYINGRQLKNEMVLIDSKAQIFPIYRKGVAINKSNIVGVDIWTLTNEQRRKYGM